MNDRKKILELVQQGKLTPEQADTLLEALGKRKQEKGKATRPWEVRSIGDLKQLGTQLSNTVSQSLADVRKTVEGELKVLSNLGIGASLSASTEVDLPATVKDVWLETRNGQIQVRTWDENFIRVQVRGQVRSNDLTTAEQQLEDSLQATQSENRYHLTILHDAKAGVLGANVEVSVPVNMESIAVQTANGEIRVDGVTAGQIRAESSNGSIWVSNSHGESLNLVTENGGIDMHESVYDTTENVYASTRNGTIVIEGVAADTNLSGVLKTAIGGIHVTRSNIRVEYIDPARKMHARLFTDGAQGTPVHVHCETRNGSIYVR